MGNVSLAGWGTGPWWDGGWACGGKGNGRWRGVHTWMSIGADCRNRACFLWGLWRCARVLQLFFIVFFGVRPAGRSCCCVHLASALYRVSLYNTTYTHSKTRICRPHKQKYGRAETTLFVGAHTEKTTRGQSEPRIEWRTRSRACQG